MVHGLPDVEILLQFLKGFSKNTLTVCSALVWERWWSLWAGFDVVPSLFRRWLSALHPRLDLACYNPTPGRVVICKIDFSCSSSTCCIIY